MPRWLYYLLALTVIAPLISLVGGSQLVTVIFIFSSLSLIPLLAVYLMASIVFFCYLLDVR
jgi:hypothetical protein